MNWIKLLAYAPELVRLVSEISKNHAGSKPAIRKEIQDRAEQIRRDRERIDAAIEKKHGTSSR